MTRFVIYVYPWLLHALLAAVAALLWTERAALLKETRPLLGTRWAAVLAALMLAAFAVRFWAVPRTPRGLFDEFQHLDLSANIVRLGAYALTMVRTPDMDVVSAPPFWPAGYHVLLSLAIRLLGASPDTAIALNSFVSALTVAALFFLLLHLRRDPLAAACGAAMLALSPLHLKYSVGAGLAAVSLFWIVVSLWAAIWHARRRTWPSLLLFGCAVGYAAHCRPENALLALLPLVLVKDAAGARYRTVFVCAVLAAGLAPSLLLRSQTVSSIFGDSAAGAWRNFAAHIGGNALYFLDLAPLAAYGLFADRRRTDAAMLKLCGVLALFLPLYSALEYGSFSAVSDAFPDRYALPLTLALMLPAAAGLSALCARRGRAPLYAAAALALMAGLSARAYGRLGDDVLAEGARADAMRRILLRLPADAVVITFSPSAVQALSQRGSISSHLLLNEPETLRAPMSRARGRLFLFHDLWSLQRSEEASQLRAALSERYRFKPYDESRWSGGELVLERLVERPSRSERVAAAFARALRPR